MKSVFRSVFPLAAVAACGFALTATATADSATKVDNFRLNDDHGATHELYYLSDMKAVVLFAQGNTCAAANGSAASLIALRDRYKSQGVVVLGINSNLNESREAVVKAAADAGSTCLSLPTIRSSSASRWG
jgi:hypothetical protein